MALPSFWRLEGNQTGGRRANEINAQVRDRQVLAKGPALVHQYRVVYRLLRRDGLPAQRLSMGLVLSIPYDF